MRAVVSSASSAWPVQRDRAGRHALAPHDTVEQLTAASAHQAVEADDLARADVETHMVDGKAARDPRQSDVLGPKHQLAHRVPDAFGEILRILPDHLANDPMRVDRGHPLMTGDAAVAQHGDVVADPDQALRGDG